MNTKSKCHIEALKETFELILIASVIALVADTIWLVHDILENGLHGAYYVVLTGLLTATILTTWAMIKHHATNYKRVIQSLLKSKLLIQRKRNKRKKG